MINNEFNLIGICTSSYQDIGNGKWKSYIFRMEVEKFGSKKGNCFEIELQVYGNNEAVDTKRDIFGKQLAVNGYIDNYTTNDGHIITKLVVQRVYPLGEQKIAVSPDVVSGTGVNENVAVEDLPTGDTIAVEDDLPF